MRIGPLAPCVVPLSPLKPLRIRQTTNKATVVFASATPFNMQADVLQYTIRTSAMGASPNASRAMLAQLLELGSNAEWQRAGIFLLLREDGVLDAQDGWYMLDAVDTAEASRDLGWADVQIDVSLRARQSGFLGSFVDAKAVPNDANLSGTTLAAYPMGTDLANEYPSTTYTFTGKNGSIGVVENPGVNLRAPVLSHTNVMTQGRCAATDENSAGTTSTEVFWTDHRNLNGYTRISNDLLRYTLHVGDTAPLVEVWNAGAWLTIGSYQLQAYNGTTYAALPLQSYSLTTVSPEEVAWAEIRYDAAGSGFVRVQNRIRRGSRLVESAVISASGQGLGGPQSVGLTGASATGTAVAADGSGVAGTGLAAAVPGFTFLTKAPVAATVAGGALYSGVSVPAGTISRLNLLAGIQDAQYTALATAAAYVQRWAAYSRTRVKQRILIGQ